MRSLDLLDDVDSSHAISCMVCLIRISRTGSDRDFA